MKKRILAAILAAMMCLPVMAEEETYETTEIVEEIQDNEESLEADEMVVVEEDEQLGDKAEAAEEISEVEEAEEDVAEEVVEENDESEAIEQSEVIENDEAAEETEEVSEEKAEEIIISAEIEVTIGSEETEETVTVQEIEETETSEENNEETEEVEETEITEETVEEIEEAEEVEEAEEQTEAEEEPEPILIMAETPMLLTATANEQTSTDSPSDDDDHGVFTVIGNSIQNHVKYSELGNITLVGTYHYKGDDVDADVTAGGEKYKGRVFWYHFGNIFYKKWTINGSEKELNDDWKRYSDGTKITASFNLGSYKNYFHSGMNTVKCRWACSVAGEHQASYTWYIYLPNVYLESIYLSSGQTFTKTEMKNSNKGFEARYWGIDESTLSLNSDTFTRTWTLNGTQISSSKLTYETGHQITSICYLKNIADKCKTGVNTLTLTMTDEKRGDTASYTWTFTVPDVAVSVSAPESVEGYLGEYVIIPITYTVSADEAQGWYYYMYIDGVVKFSNDPQYEGSNRGVRYGDWTATNEWKVLCDTTGTKTVNIKVELKEV